MRFLWYLLTRPQCGRCACSFHRGQCVSPTHGRNEAGQINVCPGFVTPDVFACELLSQMSMQLHGLQQLLKPRVGDAKPRSSLIVGVRDN